MPNRQPSIPLPQAWPRLVKLALLQAQALAHHALTTTRAWCADSPLERVRLRAENDRLRSRVAQLEEELRIKDERMKELAPAKRPHYAPATRLAILALRASTGWSTAETARRFLVTPNTIAAWMRRLDEDGEEALVRVPEPVNRYPDFVSFLIKKLRASLPAMGKVRIAQMLARAGLQLSASTVKRLARRRGSASGPPPKPSGEPAAKAQPARSVTARHPHHLWHIDLTVVPTLAGFWVPWFPFAFVLRWPFCFWVGAVLDHFSRAVVAKAVFTHEPSAEEVCAMLTAGVKHAGRAPKYIVSDRGVQFGEVYRAWCVPNGVRPRFGAIGKHGSIAVIERFWRSLKDEAFRRLILVPFELAQMKRELELYAEWYNNARPHQSLGGQTPNEVRDGGVAACARLALEVRPRVAVSRGDPGRRRRRCRKRLDVSIGYFEERAHLPLVQLQRVA